MKKQLLSFVFCLFVGVSATAQNITYDMCGGRIVLETNEDLWHMIMPYYCNFTGVARGYNDITGVGGFLSIGPVDSLFTAPTSEYKWLGDYMKIVATNQGKVIDNTEAVWRQNAIAFFNCTTSGTSFGGIDFTTAGQPSSWLPYYTEDVLLSLPKCITWRHSNSNIISWDFILPKLEGIDNVFVGWQNRDGETVTIIPANTTNETYTAVWKYKDVKSISLNHTAATISRGKTLQLEATVLPTYASNKSVIWATDNAAVATVENGLVTAKQKGTATIKAITEDGGKLATCTITVVANVENISLDYTEVTLVPKTAVTLKTTITPIDADNQNITWTSTNDEIATVSNGTIIALSVGKATITATTEDGAFTAFCIVNVEIPVTSIVINPAILHITPGNAEQIATTILPEDATNKNFTWSTDNEDVAMIIDGGWVVAVETGIAYITATTENGYKTATCQVIVGEVPDSITNEIVIIPGETTADFSWPAVKDALSYIFIIYADAAKTEKICTLTFDAQGYLVRIDFLRKPSAANNTQHGFNFLVTGLDRATTYGYTLDSYSEENTVLNRKVGQFTTLGNVATQVETLSYSVSDKVRKVLENGTLYILRGGEKYTVDGLKIM